MSPDVCRGLQKAYFNEVSYDWSAPLHELAVQSRELEKAIVTQLLKESRRFLPKPLLKRARRA